MIPKHDNGRFTAEEKRYFDWLRALAPMPCCLTGRTDGIDIAHTGLEGRGMGRKAHYETCLPLLNVLHAKEHNNRDLFWAGALGEDPVPWAIRLFECFQSEDVPAACDLLADMQWKANHDFIEELLRNAP